MQQIDLFQVFSSMVFVYGHIFSNFTLDSILAQIQLLLTIKTMYVLLSMFLPIEGLVNAIFSPFSYMHQLFHASAAKKLNKKYTDNYGRPKGQINANISLGGSSLRHQEYSNFAFMINTKGDLTLRDVMYFANSSSAPAFVMLLAIVSVGPLMQDFLLILIHLYVVCGITICLMPSTSDSKLIVNYIVLRTSISSWYVSNIFIVFFLSLGVYALKYYYLGYYPPYWEVEPILMGIWGIICYLLFFSIIVMISKEQELFTEEEQAVDRSELLIKTAAEMEMAKKLGFKHLGMTREMAEKMTMDQTEMNNLTSIRDMETNF